MVNTLSFDCWIEGTLVTLSSTSKPVDYVGAEQLFIQLLNLENLDRQINAQPNLVNEFEMALATASIAAFNETGDADARLFLQRILYRINRLNLFWYDHSQHHKNERSFYLQWVRDRIETVWQDWETTQFDLAGLQQLDAKQALIERAEVDLNPPLSESQRYLRQEMSLEGYRYLLAIASLDGLVEASRLSRILGNATDKIQAMPMRMLMEEYANGRFRCKHSTFLARMVAELSLKTRSGAYFDLVPWEVLACINHNFLLTECNRYFLRYHGGLTYFGIVEPSIYQDYLTAAQRLNLSETVTDYWELHIREDEQHRQWILHEIALPLVQKYPDNAWELVLGYDQEKWMSDRAEIAIIEAIQAAEQAGIVV
jgi:hypothetical protein